MEKIVSDLYRHKKGLSMADDIFCSNKIFKKLS